MSWTDYLTTVRSGKEISKHFRAYIQSCISTQKPYLIGGVFGVDLVQDLLWSLVVL